MTMQRSINTILMALAGTASLASADTKTFTMSSGRGRLGIVALPISPELRQHLGAPSDRGVLVDAVQPGSPAAKAGIEVGDVLLDVDSDPATSASGILGAISDRKTGDSVPLVVSRGAARVPLTVKLDTDPGPVPTAMMRGFDGFDSKMFDGSKMFDMFERFNELEHRIEKLEKQRPST
jgi:serine protease Do